MFKVIKQNGSTMARAGVLGTAHGEVETPCFFPVATQATVKGLSMQQLDEMGVEGLLANAYHLYLRPGISIIKKCGGLHRFMNFNKTIITDSGGYQIFSLEKLRRVSDCGVEFQSHVDGSAIFLRPEDVIKTQLDLGSDVIVPLDECVKFPVSYADARRSVSRTIDWARRSKKFFEQNNDGSRLFFGIVQGSTYNDLRKECLDNIMSLGLDGLCIGGLSVGEPEDLRYNTLSFIYDNIDKEVFRYFMGYGKPRDILEAVSAGTDLFDCVIPTRLGRTGTAFTFEGEVVIRNSPYISDTAPLDKECECYVCNNFSRAYLRHLINVKEMSGVQLVTYHNLFWYKRFLRDIRESIKNDNFLEFKRTFIGRYNN